MSRSFFVDSLIVQKPTVTSHSAATAASAVASVTSGSALLSHHQIVQRTHSVPSALACHYRHPSDMLSLCCPLCIHPGTTTAALPPPPPPPPPPLPAHNHHHHHHPAVAVGLSGYRDKTSSHSTIMMPTSPKSLVSGLNPVAFSGHFQHLELMASHFSHSNSHQHSPPPLRQDSGLRGGGRVQSLSPPCNRQKRSLCSDPGGKFQEPNTFFVKHQCCDPMNSVFCFPLTTSVVTP